MYCAPGQVLHLESYVLSFNLHPGDTSAWVGEYLHSLRADAVKAMTSRWLYVMEPPESVSSLPAKIRGGRVFLRIV
ncbi:hypothetical protein M758_6G200800 [Ceratodon purpureus]|nr:hypothetical protein M758_6G200800 [Ceratodon purpureus]